MVGFTFGSLPAEPPWSPRTVIEELVVSETSEQCGDQLRTIKRSAGASVVGTVFTHGGCNFDDLIN